jgi:hypothetical protein
MSNHTTLESEILTRINDWQRAFSPGTRQIRATDLRPLYVADERLLTFDTLSPSVTRISGWDNFCLVWNPFLAQLRSWNMDIVSKPSIWGTVEQVVSALIFRGYGETTDGENVDLLAHATLVWIRTDESWKIIHEHVSAPVKLGS